MTTEAPGLASTAPPKRSRIRGGVLWLANRPVLCAALLTIVGLPLRPTTPQGDLDSSWKLGLNLAIANGEPFGRKIVFTYGPLGFLSVPKDVRLGLLALGLLFIVASSFALYLVLQLWTRTWLEPTWALVAGIAFVFIAPMMEAPELAAAAFGLWILWFVEREREGHVTPLWTFAVLGSASSLLALTKVSLSPLALGVLVLALVGGRRLLRVGVVVVSTGLSLLLLWIIAGQPVSDLTLWMRRSVEIVAGFGPAMRGEGTSLVYPVLLIPLFVVLVLGVISAVRRGQRSWWFVAVLAFTFWMFLRAAFTRLEPSHAVVILVVTTMFVATLPWTRQQLRLPLGAVAFCFLILLFGVGTNLTMTSVRPRLSSIRELAESGRELIDHGYHQRRLDEARAAVLKHPSAFGTTGKTQPDPVAPSVVAALDRRGVEADPWDVAQVDALGMRWDPVPIFQNYQTYTSELDAINTKALSSADGPPSILDRSIAGDDRYRVWESPDYQVAKVCNFEMAAAEGSWQALRRSDDICGKSSLLGHVDAKAGQSIAVPAPHDPNSVVVARFNMETSLFDRALGFALRPPAQPLVDVDGHTYSFVEGTASDQHLVRQPATAAGRRLPLGPIDVRTLKFSQVDGPVSVDFYEIPLASS
jgi:hypothetical protein